jgi:hypothetical protein
MTSPAVAHKESDITIYSTKGNTPQKQKHENPIQIIGEIAYK